jgi:cell division protein FtsW (lipid II flippase)
LFGTGLGQGRPDLLPAAHTDFLFSGIGEELGLLGTVAVLLCFMLLVARGFRTAILTNDSFGQLLAAGLMTIFAIQTFVIVAGVTRLLPLTGVTLPFMSYGGSSLLANYVLIGLLVRISHQTAAEPLPAHTAEILVGGRR